MNYLMISLIMQPNKIKRNRILKTKITNIPNLSIIGSFLTNLMYKELHYHRTITFQPSRVLRSALIQSLINATTNFKLRKTAIVNRINNRFNLSVSINESINLRPFNGRVTFEYTPLP
jgi:hypothetical protein